MSFFGGSLKNQPLIMTAGSTSGGSYRATGFYMDENSNVDLGSMSSNPIVLGTNSTKIYELGTYGIPGNFITFYIMFSNNFPKDFFTMNIYSPSGVLTINSNTASDYNVNGFPKYNPCTRWLWDGGIPEFSKNVKYRIQILC